MHANVNFYKYHTQVLPHLRRLRHRFESCGCVFFTSTMFREPVSHSVSAFRFFQGHGKDSNIAKW